MSQKILVVDDEPDIRFLIKDILEDEGYEVDVAEHAVQATERKQQFLPDLVLLDIWMPEMDGVSLLKQWNESQQMTCPVVMMSGHGTVETAVEATRYGALDFVEKPLSMAKLLRTVKTALENSASQSQIVEVPEMPVGNSQVMNQLRQLMQRHAQNLEPVILNGVHGSGVRLWANYLFSLQPQRLPCHSLDAAPGAYTQGLNHNLFIREVTDLTRDQQHTLLSLLQNTPHPASRGRLIAASQFDTETLAHSGSLIPGLAEFWRNAVKIPSLNERIEDIPELLEYYVTRFSEYESLPYRHFGVAVQNLIRNHRWQGGLTELKSMIRKILQSSDLDSVELDEIQRMFMDSHLVQPAQAASGELLNLQIDLSLDLREAREVFEREYLQKQLELSGYNVSELARKIGQERTNLYRKLKSLGLQSKK